MKEVIKKRMDILDILVKRLGDTVGNEAYNKILYGKGKRPTDGEVIIKK